MQYLEKEIFYKRDSYSHSRPEKYTRFKKDCGCLIEVGGSLYAELFPCKDHKTTGCKKGFVCIACGVLFRHKIVMKEHRYTHAIQ